MTNEEAVERIKILKAFTGYDKDNQMVTELHEALDLAIKALEQQPKTGYWIKQEDGTYKCSKCKKYELWEGIYCASCGARMVESEVAE